MPLVIDTGAGNDLVCLLDQAVNNCASNDVANPYWMNTTYITCGAGADEVNASPSGTYADEVYGEDGGDTIRTGPGDDKIYGGEGADFLYGNQGSDIIHGDGEVDYIYGGTGDDYILGGEGADFLYGEDGSDDINGMDGADYLNGGDGEDHLCGGDDIDTLVGAPVGDCLCGGGDGGNYDSAVDIINGNLPSANPNGDDCYREPGETCLTTENVYTSSTCSCDCDR